MSDVDLKGPIQNLVQETIKGLKMTDIILGTVLTTSPISVQTDISMPPIPEAGLVVPEIVRGKTSLVIGGEGGTVTINESLKSGDRILMLRVSGGNRYVILSRV